MKFFVMKYILGIITLNKKYEILNILKNCSNQSTHLALLVDRINFLEILQDSDRPVPCVLSKLFSLLVYQPTQRTGRSNQPITTLSCLFPCFIKLHFTPNTPQIISRGLDQKGNFKHLKVNVLPNLVCSSSIQGILSTTSFYSFQPVTFQLSIFYQIFQICLLNE